MRSHICSGTSLRLALSILLTGAASTIALSAALAQSVSGSAPVAAVALDTLSVEGRGERGDGPVRGYVARQTFSGTKTSAKIADTPQSITVIGRQQMDDQQVRSVAESLSYTPGVIADYRGASNVRDEVFVRGFSYVPRYLDGMLFGGDVDYSKVYPYLLERVELLSGPGSVLYGQVNPGGLINMVSKKPLFSGPLREIWLTVGNRAFLQGSFDISDRVSGTESLAFRLVGTGLTTHLQEDFTRQQGIAVAPSLSWAPSPDTTLTILSGYQWEPNFGFRNFLDADGTIRPIKDYGYVRRDFFVSDPNFEKAERTQAWIGYEFEHRIGDALTLRQKLRYAWVDYEQRTLTWGRTSLDSATGAKTLISRSASGGTDAWGTLTKDNQVELKLATGPVEHTILAGLDYRDRTRDYHWGFDRKNVPSISLARPIYGYDFSRLVLDPDSNLNTSASQVGVYLQDQVTIGDLHLLAGLREDWAKTSTTDSVPRTAMRYDDSAFTYRVGALYTLPNGIAPYVSYATSFEPVLDQPPMGNTPFKPTTADQFEGGIKYTPEGTHLLLTAAYYDIVQNNRVVSAYSDTFGKFIFKQIGVVHNQGVDLSAQGDITANLSLIASYSYIDSIIERTGDPTEFRKTPPRIPGTMASLWAAYTFDTGLLRGLQLGAGIRYLGTSWGNSANTVKVPSYALVDAMLSYDLGVLDRRFDGAALQLNAKNIGNVTYVASCQGAGACFYGDGFTVTGALKYRW
ncbi:TonB-dependent siderophore receptor [Methylobacterium brachiatum]|uniref:TonB-dependent siderophore receptor n=1 Tax=Methylobacterium brachiatum TaxID=269660 RepID=UPI0008F1CAB1|nr:TonB-dependent siderophore receptor [Methylobacterium brachiatum]SFI45905.1 iron complex outermembrane recepter protein [Methylobacterium brachiatum]